MNPVGSAVIHTQRLILRPPQVQDAAALVASGSLAMTTSEAENALGNMAAEAQNPYVFHWVIEMDGRTVGRIKGWDISLHNAYVQLGYDVALEMRGRGIMTEAIRAVLRYLLEDAGVNRVYCSVRTENAASRRVCEKCGMRQEGVMRQHYARADGGYDDVVIYGMIRQDMEED